MSLSKPLNTAWLELIEALREYKREVGKPPRCFIQDCRACQRRKEIEDRLDAAILRVGDQI